MKLGVFGRAALVASLLWIAGWTFHRFSQEMDWRDRPIAAQYETCVNAADSNAASSPLGPALDVCSRNMTRDFGIAAGERGEAFGVALVESLSLLAAAWAGIGLVYAVGRWILAGSK